MRVIDLFAGCGGLSIGFATAGFRIICAIESDSSAAASYQLNHPHTNVIVKDIREVNVDEVFYPWMSEVVIGGLPCQGFSMAGA
ncbi:MAG: DNA cytosine methyltransferase, partial [Defluviitaleaceae bacterium]|nr:DNA cytosine methyltransferase [Defluviitaleaceae bacterium]